MKKAGYILAKPQEDALKLSTRPAPKVSEKAREKIRRTENAKAEIARRAVNVRMG